MPWYNYRRRPWRRHRRFWRRRSRAPLYRRYWRRRYRVRKRNFKRKLKYITLKQYQPPSVRKLKVKGTFPLFLTTNERLSNNMTLFLDSIAPEYIPGGGGFSIQRFTLQTLFKEHLQLHNWWTHSNDNYPLIRFTGCKIKLFTASNIDYLFYYQNTYPMTATQLMYTSTHPSVMLMNPKTKAIPCKEINYRYKPYKILKIKPPSQFLNKWYFQRDIAEIPLLMTIATATSLDRTYTHAGSISTTIGFTTLNTLAFQNRNFTKLPTTGYFPKPNTRYFATQETETDPKKVKIGDLIYLGNTEQYQTGKTWRSQHTQSNMTFETYMQTPAVWGNPFHRDYIHDELNIWITNANWQTLKEKLSAPDNYLNQNNEVLFTLKTEPTLIKCRYNPFKDDNKNDIYLVKINEHTEQNWDPPNNEKLILSDLPMWASTWGFIDYQKRSATLQQIDTTCCLVIKTHSVDPKTVTTLVPLDNDFLNQASPYRPHEQPDSMTVYDKQNWHPKVAFQIQTTNNIACTGPYTAKLPKGISAEAHARYTFYFKLGGDPPPMSTLTAPNNQIKFPTPDNLLKTNSLQSPTLPIEYYLYGFDQRRHELTKKALKRIKTYQETETPLLPITDSTPDYWTPDETTSTSESETEKEKEEDLHYQLLKQRKCQKQLRHRIKQLLNRLTNIQ
nr:MAG: ORF1 [TTV-like mini virus]